MATPWEKQKAGRRILSPDAAWAAEKIKLIVDGCHPKQRAFVLDPGRRVSVLCERGTGKTTALRARLLIKALRITRARLVFIAMTRLQAQELVWTGFKDTLERLGVDAVFGEVKLRCVVTRTGSEILLLGADDRKEIEKLRGRPFDEVAIDEGASYAPELLETLIVRVISPRLGDRGGAISLGGTPGHVLRGIFYDATRPGSEYHRPWEERDRPEYANWVRWSSHSWSLADGAKQVQAIANLLADSLVEIKRQGWGEDNPILLREYRGQWVSDDTEHVFRYDATRNSWDPPRIGALRIAELPEIAGRRHDDWRYGVGMDMGAKDPFALQVFAFSPSDVSRTLYHVFEYERRGMYANHIAKLILGEDDATPLGVCRHETPGGLVGQIGWPDGMVADLAHLGENIIDELSNVYGIRITAAEKKGKFGAIELFNGDLLDGRIKILKGSKLESQLSTLQWKMNEFGELKEDKGQANHSSDAAIYLRRMIAHMFDAGASAPAPRHAALYARPQGPYQDPQGLDSPDEIRVDDYSHLLSAGSYDDYGL